MSPARIPDRRIAANRANARKSTGPRTAEGKRRSSQNARKPRPGDFTIAMAPLQLLANQVSAHRDSSALQDPIARELHHAIFLALGHSKFACSLWEDLETTAYDRFPNDPQHALDWMVRQKAYMLALRRYESFHHRQFIQAEEQLHVHLKTLRRACKNSLLASKRTRALRQASSQPQQKANVFNTLIQAAPSGASRKPSERTPQTTQIEPGSTVSSPRTNPAVPAPHPIANERTRRASAALQLHLSLPPPLNSIPRAPQPLLARRAP